MIAIAILLKYLIHAMPVLVSIALGYAIVRGIQLPPEMSEGQGYLVLLGLAYGPMSLYSFIAMGTDKLIAVLNRKQNTGIQRIPERYLHLFEWLCGWPGSFIAQRVFRHKTSKFVYQLEFWAIVIFHISFVLGRYAYEHDKRLIIAACCVAAAVAWAIWFVANAQRYAEALEKAEDERDRLERQNEVEES